jgi:hypothetical protein
MGSDSKFNYISWCVLISNDSYYKTARITGAATIVIGVWATMYYFSVCVIKTQILELTKTYRFSQQQVDKGSEENRELGEKSGAATGDWGEGTPKGDWRDGTPKEDWGDGTACAGGAMPLTQLTSPVSSIFAEAVQDLRK